MQRLQLVAELKGHNQPIWNVAWSPNGQILASCGGDKTICLWGRDEAGEWALRAKLVDAHERTVRKVAFSPDGRTLLAASFDATTSVWENVNGNFTPIAALEGHEHEVKAAVFDSSGVYVATCSRDKSVWIWEKDEGDFDCVSVLHGHTQDVKSVLWHPTEALLVSCSYDDTIKLWSEGDDDWYCRQTLTGHDSTVWDVSFDRGGSRLVSCSDDRSLRVWERPAPDADWRSLAVVPEAHSRVVYSVDFSRVGKELIASVGGDNHLRVWTGEAPFVRLADSQSLGGDVNCVRWNPKEQGILASCGDDKVVRVWKFVE